MKKNKYKASCHVVNERIVFNSLETLKTIVSSIKNTKKNNISLAAANVRQSIDLAPYGKNQAFRLPFNHTGNRKSVLVADWITTFAKNDSQQIASHFFGERRSVSTNTNDEELSTYCGHALVSSASAPSNNMC